MLLASCLVLNEVDEGENITLWESCGCERSGGANTVLRIGTEISRSPSIDAYMPKGVSRLFFSILVLIVHTWICS
jgi:hypothetical protein